MDREQLAADQVRRLYENAALGAVATLVNGCILVLVLWTQVPHASLITWLVWVFLVFAVRLLVTVGYHRADRNARDAPQWKGGFFASLFLSGVLWGAPAIFLFPPASIGHQAFIAFVAGGMVAGAVGAFTSILSAFFIFAIPALLPIIIRFFSVGTQIHIAMGVMTLLFFVLMSFTAVRTHRDYLRLLGLLYENRALVEELRLEVVQRRQAERELREKNQEIEGIVAARTVELQRAVAQLEDEVAAREEEALAREKIEEQLQLLNSELESRVEQRTLELQKTQAQYLHAEKLSAVGKLSASIAHEFNNPLQAITATLKGMQQTAKLDKQDVELLQLAVSECQRMRGLIRNLQDFNRPSTGQKVSMDVNAAIESCFLLCKSDLGRKQLTVVKDLAEELPQVRAIPDQIKQVILNLLTNAADACDPGGTIAIRTRVAGKNVVLTVQDNGIGIDPEKIDHIFQPFYTTKPTGKGTGLGLSISHGIVANHQGEIRVESASGGGSTFTILLPLAPADEVPE